MSRPGFSTIELVTTLTLLALISVACALLVHSQARLLRHQTEQVTAAETMRAARAVLHGELRDIAASDVRAVAADSVAVRVFRGWGVVCLTTSARIGLRYRGLRAPDDTKDSLLVVGEERVLAFRQSTAALSCPLQPDEQLVVLDVGAAVQDGAIALIFESGAYHLSTNALRYRGATGGRQPITDQLIDTQRSYFRSDVNARGMQVQLRSVGDVLPDALGDAHIRFANHTP